MTEVPEPAAPAEPAPEVKVVRKTKDEVTVPVAKVVEEKTDPVREAVPTGLGKTSEPKTAVCSKDGALFKCTKEVRRRGHEPCGRPLRFHHNRQQAPKRVLVQALPIACVRSVLTPCPLCWGSAGGEGSGRRGGCRCQGFLFH